MNFGVSTPDAKSWSSSVPRLQRACVSRDSMFAHTETHCIQHATVGLFVPYRIRLSVLSLSVRGI